MYKKDLAFVSAAFLVFVFPIFHRTIFWGFKISNFNNFGGFQKNKLFWGIKKLWIYFFWGGGGGGHYKIRLFLGVISIHFLAFLLPVTPLAAFLK